MTFELTDRVEQTLQKIMHDNDMAGFAVGIILENQIVYAQGFGLQNMTTKEAVTPTSLFSLASISKTFVAAAIMQLVEQGKCTLDTPLTTCLPYFKLADPRVDQITLKLMLTHLSGLPDKEDYTWDPPDFDDGALKRFVTSLEKEKLDYSPGERFYYNNTAFDILGQVIAEVSSQSFESYIEEHLLRPCGMARSTFLLENVTPELKTTPYLSLPFVEPSPLYPYTRPHAPCGSLHSNVYELSNWAMVNLNRGALNGVQILPSSTYDLLWHPQAIVDEGEEETEESVGLCWFLGKYKGEKLVSHSGGDIGFTTNLALLPEKSAGVVVLFNTYPAPTDAITYAILDLILGDEPNLPKPPIIRKLSPVLKTKGLSAAIEAYHSLTQSQPAGYDISPRQFWDIGYILIEIRRLAEAIEILKLGLEIHPENDKFYFELGRAMLQSGDRENALQLCQQCLSLNPRNWEAVKLLESLSAH
jgi:CubicO group peptidase (beta-lactamase class C family)